MAGINQFQRPASPLEGLTHIASLVGAVKDWSNKSKQSDLLDQDIQAKTLANTQSGMKSEQDKKTLAALQTADSPETTNIKNTALMGLSGISKSGAIDPNTLSPITKMIQDPNTTGLQVKNFLDSDPNLKQAYTLAGDKMKADAMVLSGGQKSASFGDRNSIQVGKDYEDKLSPYRKLQEDIARVEGALGTKDKNGNPLITSQQLGDANAAIARIFSPNHMSDSTVSRTEYESYPAKFEAAVQKYTANPQDIGSRDLINHIIDQAHHIGNVSNKSGLQELDSLNSGYNDLQNSGSKKTAQAKSAFFKNRFSKEYPTVGDGGAQSSGHPQDAAAIEWARANPKDPASAQILKANGVQ